MTTKAILAENNNNKFINLLSVARRNGSSMEGTEIVLDNLDYTWQATMGHRIANTTVNNNSALVIDPVLIERFSRNRRIDAPWYHILIVLYGILIIFGALGNILVVMAVIRKPAMRTARNLFILNLAVSDLLLCLVTMPLTLIEIVTKFWPFGSWAILCKMIGMLQALSIFVSTISITAIAFDRYQLIVYPTHDSLQFVGAVFTLLGIWLLALLLASPMFIFKRLVHEDMPPFLHKFGINAISFCIEDWPVDHGAFYYSIFSLCVQYLVPIVIVSCAYLGIYFKLKNQIAVVTTIQASQQRNTERGRRMKRTNCLLISIAIIFGVSWLPLNFFNLYVDMKGTSNDVLVLYAFCHMCGMSSACSNPLLYGWLNDNFRKEFHEILCCCSANSNNALNGQITGREKTRRTRKYINIAKGDLKLLGATTTADCLAPTTNLNGLRSAATESIALTEYPTEIVLRIIS
ncbi:neuropeptide F receptor [Glossina fuscipes fuscipes]